MPRLLYFIVGAVYLYREKYQTFGLVYIRRFI
nr:MAG TPA: hypothetical protein [Caudoviricetes sp.]